MEDSCISAVPQRYIFGAKLNVVYDNVINMTSFGIPLHAALVETQGNSTQCHTKYMHSQTVPYDLYGTVICARLCDKLIYINICNIYKI